MRPARAWRPVLAVVALGTSLVAGVAGTPAVHASAVRVAGMQVVPSQDPGDETPTVGDPESTRRVYLVITGLLVLAGALAGFTVWYWRSTRPEPKALGRLETMSQRRWGRADYTDRKVQLDEAQEFLGGEGPVLDPNDVSLVSLVLPVDEVDEVEAVEGAEAGGPVEAEEAPAPVVAMAPTTLAELVEATPEPAVAPYGGSIGDPDILRALGLDDESLGLTAVEPASRQRWEAVVAPLPATVLDHEDLDDDAEDDGLVAVPRAPGAAAAMQPMFEVGAGVELPHVWESDEDEPDEVVHEREATGEFVRLVQERAPRGGPGAEPEPEQQRFSLPGEPLL